MPLIPYPDVPALPGVPALPAAIGAVLATFGLNTTSQVADDALSVQVKPVWLITDTYGNPVLTPDTIVEFEYRGEQKIPNYPVEQGSFATYNKVAMPFDARLTCVCNGSTNMSRPAFLAAIGTLLAGLNLCFVVTPDISYGPCNLIHVDYRREARQGVSLLVAQLWFQEVREAAGGTPATASPDTCYPTMMGQVYPVAPSSVQASMFSTPAATSSFLSGSSTYSALAKSVPAVLGALALVPGGAKSASQMRTMAAVSGNLTQIAASGSPIGPGVLASVPSQINTLAGALYAGSDGSLSAVASISAVSSVALVASNVINVSNISIR